MGGRGRTEGCGEGGEVTEDKEAQGQRRVKRMRGKKKIKEIGRGRAGRKGERRGGGEGRNCGG